jgi:putative phosphoesterase
MLIAFISDIHGNLPALEAAVADAMARGADRIICCGDMTGYGPFPNDVCIFLKKSHISTIIGNYDQKVLEVPNRGKSAVRKMKSKKLKILLWTVENLGRQGRFYVAGLPERLDLQFPAGGGKFLIVHGSPMSVDDAIYPSITREGLETKLGDARPDVLVCGHTHIPFVKHVGRIFVVNCGSAGHPIDGDPHPSYALVRTEEGVLPQGRVIRFDYDRERTITALRKTSLPKGLRKDFSGGIKRRFME